MTKPNCGGERRWFSCPGCGQRKGELYLPRRENLFEGRECYGLIYKSSKESHKPAVEMVGKILGIMPGQIRRDEEE